MGFVCPWWRSAGGGILSSYTSNKRDLNYLAVAYGKIVFASAGGYNSTWGKNTLGLSGEEEVDEIDLGENHDAKIEQEEDPVTGEIKTKIKTKKIKTSGVYERVTGDKFKPKAHLIAITTAGMDTLGMTQKGSYTYRTYGGLGNLPTVGETKSMAWGWAYGGKVLSGEGFSGKVIGYNISSNSEGGFDVTVELIGNNTSVSVASISADAASPEFTSQGTVDAAGNESKITGIFSSFADCQKQAAKGKAAGSGVTFNNGLTGCIIEVPEDYAKAKTDPNTADTTKTQFKAYVTFKSVVDVMNKILKTFTSTEIDSSEAMVEWWDSMIKAGNPMEMLVPGNSTYGDKVFDTGGGAFKGDPNQLLISVDMLVKYGQPTVEEGSQADGTKRRLSIKSFFDNVFSLINDNTGQAYTLTLANSATATKSDKKIYIVDFNKLPTVNATGVNTVRSANLSAKLDSDQASMFYIIKNAPRDNKQQGNNADTAPPTPADYEAQATAVGKSADEQNCAALKSSNKNLIAAKLSQAKGFGTAAPWDLSVTLDGTGGWQYGGVITYSAAGAAEKLVPGYKVGFAITNVTHNVTEGDWTTSLSTYCRIYK